MGASSAMLKTFPDPVCRYSARLTAWPTSAW
jgi:hypothetical protein